MPTDFYTKELDATANGSLDPTKCAQQIAQGALQQTDLSSELGSLWSDVIYAASDASAESQSHLADMLVALSQQPDATDASTGQPLVVYGMQVWRDMPTLGWEINSIWNSRNVSPPSTPDKRADDISRFAKSARFTALLTANPDAKFAIPYRLQILWTFRELEEPTKNSTSQAFQDLDVTVAAVAAVVEVLGKSVVDWHDEWESGPKVGAPGRGGSLWEGAHGFTEERYQLWKSRLEGISQQDNVDERLRDLASKTAQGM